MLGKDIRLEVDLGFIKLKNPLILASGTCGYGDEEVFDLNKVGGFVTKSLSLNPKKGNPPPRIYETPCGMLNSIGLENIGIERFLKEKLPKLSSLSTAIIVSIYGHSIDEYGEVAKRLSGIKEIAAIEVNISCPNVKEGGIMFGSDPSLSAKIVETVLKNTDRPVIVKLTPNVTDIKPIAKAVESAGADAISLINTLRGMAVDVERRRPVLGNVYGGLSGPAIRPVALYMTYEVVKSVRIPVIGCGGIVDWRSALEFLIVGARAIQIGTANLINPKSAEEILQGIREFCKKREIKDISEIIGSIREEG